MDYKVEEKVAIICEKCRNKPKIGKNPDTSVPEKRYFVKCSNPECKCKNVIYGFTRNMAVEKWNSFSKRMRNDPLNMLK